MGDVIHTDSFQNESSTTFGYDGWTVPASVAITFEGGPHGGGDASLKLARTGGTVGPVQMPFTATRYFSAGFWFKTSTLVSTNGTFFQVYGVTTGGALQDYIQINYNTSGSLTITGNTITPSAPSSYQIVAGEWVHIQLDVDMGRSQAPLANQTASLRINGGETISTSGSGRSQYNIGEGFSIAAPYIGNVASLAHNYANMWFAKGGFKGQAIVRQLLATAAGEVTELTPDGGGNNYEKINETSFSAAAGNFNSGLATGMPLTDTYVFADMADTPEQLIAFSVKEYHKKDGLGTSTLYARPVVYDPATNTPYLGTAQTIGTSINGKQTVWNTNPIDATALTSLSGSDAKTLIDGLEYGVKLATS